MSTNPELSIDTLAAALRLVAIGGRELWGYDEIAAYSKLESTYVANVITRLEGFPAPIRVVNARSHPRYVANEVMTWFEARR